MNAETFAALSDSTRLAVIQMLSKEPCRAGDLAAELGMTPAAMSRHLRILRRGGFIAEEGIEDDARVRIYHLRREPFEQLRGWLQEVEQFWGGQLASFKNHVDKRGRPR
jgi:DNA-binding transcriptional ArsR family regulator